MGPDQGSQDLEFCPDKGMGRLPLFKTTSVPQLDFGPVTTPASATPDSTPSPDQASPSGDIAPQLFRESRWLESVVRY